MARVKKVLYNNILFDSALEVFCYKSLIKEKIDFEYTPKTFILSSGFKCSVDSYEPDKRIGKGVYPKSKTLQSVKYTPDFVGKNFIIETKGRKNEAFPMRWKLFKKYITENNLNYTLFMPTNQTQVTDCINIIKTLR